MTVTEAEAKGKWCPYTRVSANEKDENCIGSECMAWRWKDQQIFRKYVLADDPEATEEPDRYAKGIPETWVWQPFDGEDEACWIEPENETLARRTGYCGLAGR